MKKSIIILFSISSCFVSCQTCNSYPTEDFFKYYKELTTHIDSIIDSGKYPIINSDGDFGSSTEYFDQENIIKLSSIYFEESYSGTINIESYLNASIRYLTRIRHLNNDGQVDFNYEIYYIDKKIIERRIKGDKHSYIDLIESEIEKMKNEP